MDLRVPGTAFDASIMSLLQLDLCVPYGEAFSAAANMNIRGQVALVDAAACPDSLNVDDTAFDAFYNDKIVIWIPGSPDSCTDDFWDWAIWYKRMMDAGAKAVVTIGIPGRTPGVWYTAISAETMSNFSGLKNVPYTDFIPMVECSLTSSKHTVATATMSTVETLVGFVYARTLDLTTRAVMTGVAATLGPANVTETDFLYLSNSANLTANIAVSTSLWGAMMNTPWYKFIFHGVVPTLFLLAVVLGLRFSYERISLSRNKGVSWRKLVNIPLIALAIEIVTSFVCGIFFAIDGMWDTTNSPVVGMRTLMLFSLTLTSMGSSVLVGLSFSDFRQSSKKLRAPESSFVQNHRVGLVLGGVGLITLEIISTELRRYSEKVYTAANSVAMFAGLLIAIWFANEAWSFSKILHGLASNNATGGPGTDRLRMVLRHTRLWASISSSSLLVILILAFIGIFNSELLWSVNGWPWLMSMSLIGRGIYAISKVVLCRLPQTQRGVASRFGTPATQRTSLQGTGESKLQLENYSYTMNMPSRSGM